MLTIRTAQTADLPALLDIYAHARTFMRESGNASQWGDNLPPKDLLEADIVQQQLFAVTDGDAVHGVFALVPGDDPTYRVIQDGAWLSDTPYAAIHRVASDGAVRGIFDAVIAFCRERQPHLRIDTHANNHVMQHLILKKGFSFCGTIFVADGTPRLAFERL